MGRLQVLPGEGERGGNFRGALLEGGDQGGRALGAGPGERSVVHGEPGAEGVHEDCRRRRVVARGAAQQRPRRHGRTAPRAPGLRRKARGLLQERARGLRTPRGRRVPGAPRHGHGRAADADISGRRRPRGGRRRGAPRRADDHHALARRLRELQGASGRRGGGGRCRGVAGRPVPRFRAPGRRVALGARPPRAFSDRRDADAGRPPGQGRRRGEARRRRRRRLARRMSARPVIGGC
mmetsp:Transcript_61105/g.176075  ORF Transcript_61105/g.176075 Transcript_61105/m.176075 type:complete len:237 (+) Transcript_61105:366-1076(+)